MKTKICTKCGKEKLATLKYFSPNKRYKSGLQSWCKECYRKHGREHQQEYRQLKRKIVRQKYQQTANGCLHQIYDGIKRRCNNPECSNYKDYGGRGIQNKFISVIEFINYIVNILKINPVGLQIDRINNGGHYEKGNIRFVTAKENANNRRNNVG